MIKYAPDSWKMGNNVIQKMVQTAQKQMADIKYEIINYPEFNLRFENKLGFLCYHIGC